MNKVIPVDEIDERLVKCIINFTEYIDYMGKHRESVRIENAEVQAYIPPDTPIDKALLEKVYGDWRGDAFYIYHNLIQVNYPRLYVMIESENEFGRKIERYLILNIVPYFVKVGYQKLELVDNVIEVKGVPAYGDLLNAPQFKGFNDYDVGINAPKKSWKEN